MSADPEQTDCDTPAGGGRFAHPALAPRPDREAVVERLAVSFSDKAISLLDIPEDSPVLSRIIDEMRVEIAALLPSEDGWREERERLRATLAIGEKFVDACFSAWSCGEPEHRVRKMLDLADEFRAALSYPQEQGDKA